MDRINDADDHRIDRQALGFGRQPGAGALGNQHEFALAGANRVDGHKGASRCFQRAARLGVECLAKIISAQPPGRRSPGRSAKRSATMDFSFSKEHQLLRKALREFSEQEILPRIEEIENSKNGPPADLMRKAAEYGIFGIVTSRPSCPPVCVQRTGRLDLAIFFLVLLQECLSFAFS